MRKYIRCCMCDRPIYYGDDTHDQDKCYEVNGDYFCEDCDHDYLEENCKVVLSNEA